MKIGIDCRTILNPQAGERAGIAHYTYHLVKSLLALDKIDEFVLFFDHRARNIVKEFLEPNTSIRFFTFSRYKKYLPFVYSHILSASTVAAQNLHVYHSPANVSPAGYSRPFVVTIHDLAIYRDPSLFPSRQGFSIKYLVPRSLSRAQHIIAISESTKKDVQEFFSVKPEKISTIYLGVEHERFASADSSSIERVRASCGIKRDYLLFVGTLEPRKNLIRLLEAFYTLLSRRPELIDRYQLVLAGSPGWLYEEIFEEVKSRGLESSVVFPGYVPASDVPALYAGASLFVYPSLYEGFGLPVLEAMAAGVPVISSSVSSLPEITGDAAVLVDPLDVEGLAMALERLIASPALREEYGRRGQERAAYFSWRRCAERTLEVYRSIRPQK